MKYLTMLLFFANCFFTVHAQGIYVAKGKIEYEKVVNVLKVIEENFSDESDKIWLEAYKKSAPKISNSFFDLYFTSDKSLYKPGKEVAVAQRPPDWVNGQANDNIVFNDLISQASVSQKNVFENTYLVKDSLKNLKWKISNDTRTIAGFECRKATTIIMDSVFVVAFFSEQILCTSGPEGFNGLPGLILGLAIPRLHTTWYADKLELIDIKEADISIPKKGKTISNKDLRKELDPFLKDRGKNAIKTIWQIMI